MKCCCCFCCNCCCCFVFVALVVLSLDITYEIIRTYQFNCLVGSQWVVSFGCAELCTAQLQLVFFDNLGVLGRVGFQLATWQESCQEAQNSQARLSTKIKLRLTLYHPIRLQSKIIIHKRSSSIKSLPSKFVFHQRSSSIKGHLPSKNVFSQRLSNN